MLTNEILAEPVILLTAMVLALLMDRCIGEVSRWHPLVGLGRYARAVETCLNRQGCGFATRRLLGVIALLVVLLPLSGLGLWLLTIAAHTLSVAANIVIAALVLYLVIGGQSLKEHARAVKGALDAQDLQLARTRVGYIVSRETGHLDCAGVCKATLESVLENGSDAVFAPLFWFVVAGPMGALLYRIINTLDAMWGYRNRRFHAFGWGAARLDDLANWIPARLCALTYALVSRYSVSQSLKAWRRQAPACESPNAGPVMAAGAGALNVELGGTAVYHGRELARPPLGYGISPGPADIERGLGLVQRGVLLWVALVAVMVMVCLR